MQQKIIFGLEGIQINATQLITNNQIFTLKELRAVKHGMIEPRRWISYLCVLTGSFLLFFEEIFIVIGGFSIMFGVMGFFSAKTLYTVVVENVHGEHQAFASESSDAVDKVIRVLNAAIINRGYS